MGRIPVFLIDWHALESDVIGGLTVEEVVVDEAAEPFVAADEDC